MQPCQKMAVDFVVIAVLTFEIKIIIIFNRVRRSL